MKIAIIYHTESGNEKRIAQLIAEGAKRSSVVNVKMMSIEEVDHPYLLDSKAIIIGCPAQMGTFSWQMKKWLDTKYTKGQLKGKLGSVFCTSDYFGGGAEIAELGLIGHLLVKGLLVYTAGTTQGQPYTHFGAVAIKDGIDYQEEKARILGERIAQKAIELFLYNR